MQNDKRLIDANALEKQLVEVEIVTPPHNHYCSERVVFGYDISDAPTIDAVEVVHGRWIANNICSACWKGIKGWAIQSGYKFCPFCGAKMDGGAD